MGTETTRPSSAAQCVASVAVAELPVNQWNTLIGTLVNKVVTETSTERTRESALEAIGYICQDIAPEVLETQSNQILTAIIYGMRKVEPSNHVRLAATNALHNSLEFTKANFDKQAERNYIMEVVCESTQSPETQISVAALQCLVKILSLYYQVIIIISTLYLPIKHKLVNLNSIYLKFTLFTFFIVYGTLHGTSSISNYIRSDEIRK